MQTAGGSEVAAFSNTICSVNNLGAFCTANDPNPSIDGLRMFVDEDAAATQDLGRVLYQTPN